MAKRYEVSVTFRKKVSQKSLPSAVKSATRAKVKGFKLDGFSSHEAFEETKAQPVRIVKRSKGRKK